MKEALLIVAHGSKVAETDEIMKDYSKALSAKRPELQFSYCYLQLMNPDIHTAVKDLYNSGVRKLKVFPFFIFNGNHIREDIPEVLEEIQSQYPDLEMTFLANIGFDDKMVDLMLERIEN
ncbi:sirohydrochlorin chelatase [Fusibacter sp. JL298sf-3]